MALAWVRATCYEGMASESIAGMCADNGAATAHSLLLLHGGGINSSHSYATTALRSAELAREAHRDDTCVIKRSIVTRVVARHEFIYAKYCGTDNKYTIRGATKHKCRTI